MAKRKAKTWIDIVCDLFDLGEHVLGALAVSSIWWACWTWGGIGAKYFYFLPTVFQSIPYWDSFGLFLVANGVGNFIQKFTPKLVSVDNSNNTTSLPSYRDFLGGAGVPVER